MSMPINSTNYEGVLCHLCDSATKRPIYSGDEIITKSLHERVEITGGCAPHKPSSEGKVWIRPLDDKPRNGTGEREVFTSVCGAEWVAANAGA